MKTSHILLTLGLLTSAAHAQDVNLSSLDAEPNRIYLTTGAEHGFVAGGGYTRILPFLDRHLVLTGEVMFPWAGADVSDFKVRANALVPLVGTEHLKLAATLSPIVRSTTNPVGRMTNAGVDVGLVGGYYTKRWFAGVEAGFDALLSTHVTHSDEYRDLAFMDAKDGWYSNAGGNLRGGIQAGVAFGPYDLTLRAGRMLDVSGGAPMLPLYANLSFDARW